MEYDELYKALADAHRREIVSELCRQPVVAGELARRVGLAPNALSFHLKWLRSAGLVALQRRGRNLWYRLNPATLSAWREHVNRSFVTAFAEPLSIPAAPTGPRRAGADPLTPYASRGADPVTPYRSDEPDLPSELL